MKDEYLIVHIEELKMDLRRIMCRCFDNSNQRLYRKGKHQNMGSKEKLEIIVGDDSAFKDIFGHLLLLKIFIII